MKLLMTTLGTLLLITVLFLTIRFWGFSQRFQVFEHSFFKDASPILAVSIQSEKDAQAISTMDPKVVFWLDVRMSQDETLFIQKKGLLEPFLTLEKLGPERFHGDRPYFYSLQSLKVFFPELLELRTFLQSYPQQKIILNIQDNAQNIHLAVIKLIEELNLSTKLLIQSDIDIVLKSLKEEKPTWLFGTSTPELIRILTFESLGLEMAPSIRADVWITPFRLKERIVFKESIFTELKRRQKRVFLSGIAKKEEFFDAQRYKFDGLVFDNVETFKEFLAQAKSP